jgi:hypothetical protein
VILVDSIQNPHLHEKGAQKRLNNVFTKLNMYVLSVLPSHLHLSMCGCVVVVVRSFSSLSLPHYYLSFYLSLYLSLPLCMFCGCVLFSLSLSVRSPLL